MLLPELRHLDRHVQVQGPRKARWRRDHLTRRNTTYQGAVEVHLDEHPAAVAQAHQEVRPEGLHAEVRVHLAHHLLRAAALHGVRSALAHHMEDVHINWSRGYLKQPEDG